MQLYGRGLRRRLPTMLGGDQRRIRLAYSLVLGLPGTPTLFYGEEIGMARTSTCPAGWPSARRCSGKPGPARRLLDGATTGDLGPALPEAAVLARTR